MRLMLGNRIKINARGSSLVNLGAQHANRNPQAAPLVLRPLAQGPEACVGMLSLRSPEDLRPTVIMTLYPMDQHP